MADLPILNPKSNLILTRVEHYFKMNKKAEKPKATVVDLSFKIKQDPSVVQAGTINEQIEIIEDDHKRNTRVESKLNNIVVAAGTTPLQGNQKDNKGAKRPMILCLKGSGGSSQLSVSDKTDSIPMSDWELQLKPNARDVMRRSELRMLGMTSSVDAANSAIKPSAGGLASSSIATYGDGINLVDSQICRSVVGEYNQPARTPSDVSAFDSKKAYYSYSSNSNLSHQRGIQDQLKINSQIKPSDAHTTELPVPKSRSELSSGDSSSKEPNNQGENLEDILNRYLPNPSKPHSGYIRSTINKSSQDSSHVMIRNSGSSKSFTSDYLNNQFKATTVINLKSDPKAISPLLSIDNSQVTANLTSQQIPTIPNSTLGNDLSKPTQATSAVKSAFISSTITPSYSTIPGASFTEHPSSTNTTSKLQGSFHSNDNQVPQLSFKKSGTDLSSIPFRWSRHEESGKVNPASSPLDIASPKNANLSSGGVLGARVQPVLALPLSTPNQVTNISSSGVYESLGSSRLQPSANLTSLAEYSSEKQYLGVQDSGSLGTEIRLANYSNNQPSTSASKPLVESNPSQNYGSQTQYDSKPPQYMRSSFIDNSNSSSRVNQPIYSHRSLHFDPTQVSKLILEKNKSQQSYPVQSDISEQLISNLESPKCQGIVYKRRTFSQKELLPTQLNVKNVRSSLEPSIYIEDNHQTPSSQYLASRGASNSLEVSSGVKLQASQSTDNLVYHRQITIQPNTISFVNSFTTPIKVKTEEVKQETAPRIGGQEHSSRVSGFLRERDSALANNNANSMVPKKVESSRPPVSDYKTSTASFLDYNSEASRPSNSSPTPAQANFSTPKPSVATYVSQYDYLKSTESPNTNPSDQKLSASPGTHQIPNSLSQKNYYSTIVQAKRDFPITSSPTPVTKEMMGLLDSELSPIQSQEYLDYKSEANAYNHPKVPSHLFNRASSIEAVDDQSNLKEAELFAKRPENIRIATSYGVKQDSNRLPSEGELINPKSSQYSDGNNGKKSQRSVSFNLATVDQSKSDLKNSQTSYQVGRAAIKPILKNKANTRMAVPRFLEIEKRYSTPTVAQTSEPINTVGSQYKERVFTSASDIKRPSDITSVPSALHSHNQHLTYTSSHDTLLNPTVKNDNPSDYKTSFNLNKDTTQQFTMYHKPATKASNEVHVEQLLSKYGVTQHKKATYAGLPLSQNQEAGKIYNTSSRPLTFTESSPVERPGCLVSTATYYTTPTVHRQSLSPPPTHNSLNPR